MYGIVQHHEPREYYLLPRRSRGQKRWALRCTCHLTSSLCLSLRPLTLLARLQFTFCLGGGIALCSGKMDALQR
jgi:hypothetical protein